MAAVMAELGVLQLRAAILKALRKQGAAVAYERDLLAWHAEDCHDAIHDAQQLIVDLHRELGRLRQLNHKLLKKIHEITTKGKS